MVTIEHATSLAPADRHGDARPGSHLGNKVENNSLLFRTDSVLQSKIISVRWTSNPLRLAL
jgi:hypothetical protein